MSKRNISRDKLVRVCVAAAALSALAVVAGRALLPGTPAYVVLGYGLLGALAVVGVLFAATYVVNSIYQFALKFGATDTQWLWFSSDPPGLAKMRGRVQAQTAPRAPGTKI